MIKESTGLILSLFLTGCLVVPVNDHSPGIDQNYQCGLSTDKKTLKVVNLNEGSTQFYSWQDEIFSVISIPTSAVISATYVLVNNIYHLGEKQIKCRDSENQTDLNNQTNAD